MSPSRNLTSSSGIPERLISLEVHEEHRLDADAALRKEVESLSERVSDLEAKLRKALLVAALAAGSVLSHSSPEQWSAIALKLLGSSH